MKALDLIGFGKIIFLRTTTFQNLHLAYYSFYCYSSPNNISLNGIGYTEWQ